MLQSELTSAKREIRALNTALSPYLKFKDPLPVAHLLSLYLHNMGNDPRDCSNYNFTEEVKEWYHYRDAIFALCARHVDYPFCAYVKSEVGNICDSIDASPSEEDYPGGVVQEDEYLGRPVVVKDLSSK